MGLENIRYLYCESRPPICAILLHCARSFSIMAAAAAAAASASFAPSLPSRTVSRPSSNSPFFLPSTSSLRSPQPSSFLMSPLALSPGLDYIPSLFLSIAQKKASRIFAVVKEEPINAAETSEGPSEGDTTSVSSEERELQVRPRVLYVCNIPRSCDIAELSELFKPYGTVLSVEVPRNAVTGLSRGCGYVTMSSAHEAKAAVTALDGTDLGGREMRVRFSDDQFSLIKKTDVLNASPKNVVFESPHKAYVGNLAWSVRPQHLREHFSQFGAVVSAKVLFDRKAGKTRVFGFVSFSSPEELKAALSSNGMEFHGRTLLVKEVLNKE